MTGLVGNTQILLQERESSRAPDSELYTTFMMPALKTPQSLATDAFVYFLAPKQRQGGNWLASAPHVHQSRMAILRVLPCPFERFPFTEHPRTKSISRTALNGQPPG